LRNIRWNGWFALFVNLVFCGLSVFLIQFFVNFHPIPDQGNSDEKNQDRTADRTLVFSGFRKGRALSWGYRAALDGLDIIRVDHCSGVKINWPILDISADVSPYYFGKNGHTAKSLRSQNLQLSELR